MGTSLKIALYGVICSSAFTLCSTSFAQEVENEKNTNGFFPSGVAWFNDGAATTVFSKDPEKTDSPDVGFYKEREEKKFEEELDSFSMLPAAQKHDATKPPPFDTRKASSEQLVAFYGKPDEDPVIPSEEKAPVPFKAMMAAMDSGNDELAYGYARQYVRYMKNMSERVDRTVKFQELAVEREGVRPGNLKDNPFVHILEKDFEKEETKKQLSLSGLDPKAQRMIRQAELEASHESALNPNEAQANNIPVDPKGEVDAYLVFTLGDRESIEQAKKFQELVNSFSKNSRIKFLALSRNTLSGTDSIAFADRTGLSVPIQDGSRVAVGLGVNSTSAIIFVARNTKQTYMAKNEQEVSDLVQVIEQISGRGGI